MKLKSVLLYILFFTASSLVFVFLLFPRAEFANYLSYTLKNENLVVTFDSVKPAIPFKLKFENTKLLIGQNINQDINQNINQGIYIVPQSFEVFLDPVSIFKDKKQVKFKSDFYQGSIKGHLFMNSFDPFSFSHATAVMSDVRINDFNYKTDLADINLGCKLDGEYKQARAGDKKDLGSGRVLVRNFSAEMKDSLFNKLNFPVIDFSDITIEFIHHPKRVTLTLCSAKGPIINVKLKGSMDIVFPVQKTRLNITGVILPDSPYLAKFANMAAIKSVAKNIKKNGIVFKIKGTLEKPEIEI